MSEIAASKANPYYASESWDERETVKEQIMIEVQRECINCPDAVVNQGRRDPCPECLMNLLSK